MGKKTEIQYRKSVNQKLVIWKDQTFSYIYQGKRGRDRETGKRERTQITYNWNEKGYNNNVLLSTTSIKIYKGIL